MYAWQFAKMLYTADKMGVTRFATMQNHYNLVYREEEREMPRVARRSRPGLLCETRRPPEKRSHLRSAVPSENPGFQIPISKGRWPKVGQSQLPAPPALPCLLITKAKLIPKSTLSRGVARSDGVCFPVQYPRPANGGIGPS